MATKKSTKETHVIVAVHVTDRVQNASSVQEVFTQVGANIKTRLGLSAADGTASGGLILLEMVGDEKVAEKMMKLLAKIKGVEAKKVVFKH